jgi:hypothetical protein
VSDGERSSIPARGVAAAPGSFLGRSVLPPRSLTHLAVGAPPSPTPTLTHTPILAHTAVLTAALVPTLALALGYLSHTVKRAGLIPCAGPAVRGGLHQAHTPSTHTHPHSSHTPHTAAAIPPTSHTAITPHTYTHTVASGVRATQENHSEDQEQEAE